jgi:hypothetical protein
MVVFPGEKIGCKSDEKVERQKKEENAKELGYPFTVEVHTQLSAFSRSHAGISRVGKRYCINTCKSNWLRGNSLFFVQKRPNNTTLYKKQLPKLLKKHPVLGLCVCHKPCLLVGIVVFF